MSEFLPAIGVDDLTPGKCTEARVGGKAIALFNVDGVFHALSNTCVHRGGPLGQGMLDGAIVMCPWHAWTFDVTTGMSNVNPSLSVACYQVKVENGQVMVKVE